MKESGSLDLKARRKDHMLPRKGQPKSPGGREYCLSPNLVSWSHRFVFFSTHFRPTWAPNIMHNTTLHIIIPNSSINIMLNLLLPLWSFVFDYYISLTLLLQIFLSLSFYIPRNCIIYTLQLINGREIEDRRTESLKKKMAGEMIWSKNAGSIGGW